MKLFFGSFRKSEVGDPETFAAGCTRLFTAYPLDAVAHVIDPQTGLPGRSEWVPSLKVIREALEAFEAERGRAAQRDARASAQARQIDERRAWDKPKQNRPTLEQLRARHGENWGLASVTREASGEALRRRNAILEEANRKLFTRDCLHEGVNPEGRWASPKLERLVRGRTVEREGER